MICFLSIYNILFEEVVLHVLQVFPKKLKVTLYCVFTSYVQYLTYCSKLSCKYCTFLKVFTNCYCFLFQLSDSYYTLLNITALTFLIFPIFYLFEFYSYEYENTEHGYYYRIVTYAFTLWCFIVNFWNLKVFALCIQSL